MPFTPSHIAAAMPFVRTPLPIAPLVIGTMAPDVPYFVPLRVPRDLTHSLAGVPTIDLALTAVLVLLWYVALRAPIVDLLPAALRERIPPPGPLGRRGPLRGWLVAAGWGILAALVGILSHLAWDSFTHQDSPVVLAVPLLHAQLGPLQVSSWLQHASTVGGLVAIALWVRAWMRRTARVPAAPLSTPTVRAAVWVGVAAAFVFVGLAITAIGVAVGISPFDPGRIFVSVTIAGGVVGLLGVLVCATWWAARGMRGLAAVSRN